MERYHNIPIAVFYLLKLLLSKYRLRYKSDYERPESYLQCVAISFVACFDEMPKSAIFAGFSPNWLPI
jgi:hypothetical protein